MNAAKARNIAYQTNIKRHLKGTIEYVDRAIEKQSHDGQRFVTILADKVPSEHHMLFMEIMADKGFNVRYEHEESDYYFITW